MIISTTTFDFKKYYNILHWTIMYTLKNIKRSMLKSMVKAPDSYTKIIEKKLYIGHLVTHYLLTLKVVCYKIKHQCS